MKLLVLVLAGLILGALGGAAAGIAAGLLWVNLAHTSDFEGYSGMLVFLTFMPVGAVLGGLAGALGLGAMALRNPSPPSNRGP